ISYVQSMTSDIVLIMGINLDECSRNDNHQIYQIDIRTGKLKTLGDKLDRSNEVPGVVTDSVFSPSLPIQKFKDDFYFKQVERDREMLYRINLKGNYEAINTGMKTINSFCVTDKGIFLIGLHKLKLSELYFFSQGKLSQLSLHNQWLEDLFLSKAERMIINADNIEIDGFVFPPIDIRDDQHYPAVLMIHGGPKMIYSDVFAHDIQLLCANGYYVFCANPMGSDGRGDDFLNIRGSFGELPYKQLMAFTDGVLEKYPAIDIDHLGVSGGSYGGYMTNYIITRTSRFQAAVSERGISNLMTAFTSSDIGYQFIFEYLGNKITPWSDPIKAIESSPIYLADKATTPTLFIHGKNDYRCHYTESLNMFSALKYHGIETRMCLFEDENHGLVVHGRPRSKMRRYEEFLSWFNKFLKKGSV
ncbi:MAG: S9 family peptidase, partial [Clostridiales bacterium]|nr:S9 family peptidase [Clostridiales bacterium]